MKKISIVRARRLFNEGRIIYLMPSKVRLDNPWIAPVGVARREFSDSFEKTVNAYNYYNGAMGKATFWLEEES